MPALPNRLRDTIARRLAAERGALTGSGPSRVALVYPSPYHVAMSSLGYQTVYRELHAHPGVCADRAFAPDTDAPAHEPVVCYETREPLSAYPVLALSVAYENELLGLVRTLSRGGVPALAEERTPGRDPFVLAGGPLTFSNPGPLAPFVDAVVMGEAEDVIHTVMDTLLAEQDPARRLDALAAIPHVWVPSRHGDALPGVAKSSRIPAYSQIRTPDTELSDMFLIEAERGCSRTCQYCVMRRSTNGGMRIVPLEQLLETIPADVPRVGLVGAAVSDHPRIVDLVNALADRGQGVGLSSLRPDRLTDPFVAALKRGGYRTLTTAMDGPSERLRGNMERHAKVRHLERAADLARAHGMQTLKLYLMVGLPSETDEDIDECVAFVSGLAARVPIALGVAPFVSKRNTPLDGLPFAGVPVVEARLERLRRGLAGRAEVRPISARWAWVEWVLAQGGAAEGRAVHQAVAHGGSFSDLRKAFGALGHDPRAGTARPRPRKLSVLSDGAAPGPDVPAA